MFNNISISQKSILLTLKPLNVLKDSDGALFHNAKIHIFFHTAKKSNFLGMFNDIIFPIASAISSVVLRLFFGSSSVKTVILP